MRLWVHVQSSMVGTFLNEKRFDPSFERVEDCRVKGVFVEGSRTRTYRVAGLTGKRKAEPAMAPLEWRSAKRGQNLDSKTLLQSFF